MLDYYSLIHLCNDSFPAIARALYWYAVEIGDPTSLVRYDVENDETTPTDGHAWELIELFRSDYGVYVDLMILADGFDYEYE